MHRLDRECADICTLAVKSMQSNSPFASQICQLCAEICEACGNACKKHDHHEHCRNVNVQNLTLDVQRFAVKWLLKNK